MAGHASDVPHEVYPRVCEGIEIRQRILNSPERGLPDMMLPNNNIILMTDLIPNSAILGTRGRSWARLQARRWRLIGGRMAELLMKSAILG